MGRCSRSLLHVALAAVLLGGGQGTRFLKKTRNSYRQTLHNFQNVQYYADFKIGGQAIAGIFDTGSFELLVRSTRCEHCVHPTPAYDHTKSETYIENGTVTKHVFGSGPCISMMGFDVVTVGDMVSEQQAFWEIIDHKITVMDTAKFAAIVGIGPNFGFGNKEKTLLMSYGVNEFSICLGKESNSDGYLTWGPESTNLDDSKYAKAQVIGKHHWVTSMHNATFDRPMSHLAQVPCGGSGCAAIIDSGTSLISAPGIALMQLSEQIPPIKEDCSNLDELPVLQFNLNGTDFTLPPQAYVMRVTGATLEADDIWDILFFKPKIRKLNMCMPAFMQMDMMSQFGPVWILGMPFFRYYHTTFDRDNKEMKFARAGDDCKPEPFEPYSVGERTQSLLSYKSNAFQPLDVQIDKLVPPTLSEQLDFPFGSNGEIDL